jgi:hypothetical protein
VRLLPPNVDNAKNFLKAIAFRWKRLPPDAYAHLLGKFFSTKYFIKLKHTVQTPVDGMNVSSEYNVWTPQNMNNVKGTMSTFKSNFWTRVADTKFERDIKENDLAQICTIYY